MTTPWLDSFNRPDPDALASGVGEPNTDHVALLRKRLGQTGRSESVEWREPPLRWALAYKAKGEPTPSAYLVPDPEAPRLVVRVTAKTLETLQPSDLSKGTRAVLARTPCNNGVMWPEWPAEEIVSRFEEVTRLLADEPGRGG